MRPSRPDVDARSLVALARYNRWANERVLDCVSRLDDAARSEPAPGTAGSIAITLAHLTDTEVHFTGLVRGVQALTHSHQHRTQVAAATDLRGVPVTKTEYIDYVDAINVTP